MSAAIAPWIQHADGITTVDAEYVRPGFASVHLVARGGRVAVVDTGANSTVPLVLRALKGVGLDTDAVDWIFLTHVHLDHAGGVGLLLPHFPCARVVVHPRGAPHLVDPSRLQAATMSVYGQQAFQRLYGSLMPIPEPRLHETYDGERLRLGTSKLTVLHTPGHALHHQVLFDADTESVFTGDTFGLSYRELDTEAGPFVIPTTTPTQFDPAQLVTSIERIAALRPSAVYLTHYGRLTNVEAVARQLIEQIDAFVHIAHTHTADPDAHAAIRRELGQYIIARAQRHGIVGAATLVEHVLHEDLELNTQGLMAWLARLDASSRDQ